MRKRATMYAGTLRVLALAAALVALPAAAMAQFGHPL